MAADLLPCPLCGCDSVLGPYNAHPTNEHTITRAMSCSGCGCRLTVAIGRNGKATVAGCDAELCVRWNRRAPPLAAPAQSATTDDEMMRAHAYERREQVVQALAATALAMVNAIDRNVFPPGEAAAFMLLRENLFHYGRELHGRPAAPPPGNLIADRPTPPAAPAAVTDDMVRAYWNATNQLGHARGFRDIGDEIKPGAAEYIRVGIAAALAAAASAERGEAR